MGGGHSEKKMSVIYELHEFSITSLFTVILVFLLDNLPDKLIVYDFETATIFQQYLNYYESNQTLLCLILLFHSHPRRCYHCNGFQVSFYPARLHE